MLATIGHELPFAQGRQQMELLAGLCVTTKAVERTAEAIGADIEARQQRQRAQATQFNVPIPMGPRIPLLYVEMDGTGIPAGRAGKQDGQPAHTREVKLGCVFVQTTVDVEGYPIRDEASTSYVGAIERSRAARNSAAVSMPKLGDGAGPVPKKVVLGDGSEWIWNHLWTFGSQTLSQ
jgi:hypothetical protein